MTEKEVAQLHKVKLFLESIKGRMIAELSEIIGGNYGLYEDAREEEIAFLDFEINQDGYSINLYPSDEDYSQLGYKAVLSEFPNGFVRDKNLGLSLSEYDFDNEEDLNRMDDFYEALDKDFSSWFTKCWDEADGKNATKPFYLMAHDSNSAFDLKEKKWIDTQERLAWIIPGPKTNKA